MEGRNSRKPLSSKGTAENKDLRLPAPPVKGALERKDPRVRVGKGGEDLAEACLLAKGYRLIERRFRVRNGEIDLVMSDRGTIVFVEVRTRRSSLHGDPLESIGPLKRARLVRTARLFLASRRAHDCPCRFDVVAVKDREGKAPEIDHRVDAFRADG